GKFNNGKADEVFSTHNRYVARYVRTSTTTTDPAFICPWTRIHRIRGRYNRSAELSLLPKLAVCITDTNGELRSCVCISRRIRSGLVIRCDCQTSFSGTLYDASFVLTSTFTSINWQSGTDGVFSRDTSKITASSTFTTATRFSVTTELGARFGAYFLTADCDCSRVGPNKEGTTPPASRTRSESCP